MAREQASASGRKRGALRAITKIGGRRYEMRSQRHRISQGNYGKKAEHAIPLSERPRQQYRAADQRRKRTCK